MCITGMGWTTALGDGLDEVWQRLTDGRVGIRESTGDGRPPAALLTDDGPAGPPSERQIALAVTTATAALRDAGCPAGDVDTLVLGSSLGPHLDDAAEISPHDLTSAVAAQLGVPGAVSVSTACSSGADALAAGAALLTGGEADRCLCGGIDLLTESKLLGHRALGTLAASGTVRPFDTDRDGTLFGEGAGFLLLETRAAATARGARILGELRGWGASNDGTGPTAPDETGAGAVLAVRRALARGGADTQDIAVINAHGTGTRANDTAEAACYGTVFGPRSRALVFATKPALGHTLGATGALEAIALLLALRHGTVPPLPHTRSVMPELALALATDRPREFTGSLGISLTLGFGGFNTCLLLTADEPPSAVGGAA
ncbi:beta-ketoacyl synthase N-terminal-like domain-containing protein [Streptomyces asoensis]|uniref:beta-ketoacyl synthase N-terminal-like domain-containing protein n=1 Tax=Streptomyces TaxID=1883 RepID=UPI00190A4D96|nr:beta-ketoacyl synthase N-terminal-like domain-containing protein [Streptomyces sp. MBT49]MBK3628100.1 beta-ketoacyl-[acyl-carrier-protein] synthase family protein [Streptomyces sp. MBT49]